MIKIMTKNKYSPQMAGKISFPQVLLERVADSNKITCLSVKKKTTYIEKDQTFSSWMKGLGLGLERLIDTALRPIMEQRPAYTPVKGCTVNIKVSLYTLGKECCLHLLL